MWTAAILAGGHGRRMGGRPKALLPVGRTRIIDRQLTALRTVADQVAIVVGGDRDRYEGLGVPVWTDVRPECGPLGGIWTALVHTTTDVTLVVAGDMPFLTAPFLRYLAQAARGVDIAIPCSDDGYHPLCAAYRQTCRSAIQRQLDAGALKVMDLLPTVSLRAVESRELAEFDPDGTLLFNINTPEDYARSLQLSKNRQD